MAGEFFSASSKAFLKLLSDSPASLLMISGPGNRNIILVEFVKYGKHLHQLCFIWKYFTSHNLGKKGQSH